MRMVLRRIVRTALALASTSLVGCASGFEMTYSADPITGWIADAGTGQPIEGVNVVAGWQLEGGLEGIAPVGWFKVLEAVTDASGKFTLPGWGPERKKVMGILRDGAPLLMFFKSGFEFRTASNLGVLDHASTHTQSYWNGKTIKLQRFKGGVSEYAEKLSSILDVEIDTLLKNRDECNWKAIPKFLWAVEQQNVLFKASGAKAHMRPLAYVETRYGSRCGSLKQYVEEHGQ